MQPNLDSLTQIAQKLRARAVVMVHRARASHLGSCLSMADLVAALYWDAMRIDPFRPDWSQRDRFFLSKGHGAALLYAALAERGFFPVEELAQYCLSGSRLTGHVTSGVPGVEFSTGSLGHGLPVACGVALAAKRDNLASRIFVLCSDGELDEGSNWEAILCAPQHKLDNLVLVIDYNKIQSFGRTKDVLDLDPLADKLKAFRWAVREIDGHNMAEITDSFRSMPFEPGRPNAVIAHTVKGRGVSAMEDLLAWHYKSPTAEQVQEALIELGVSLRTAFIEQLCDLARQDDRIWLVCGDLGYAVLEKFSDNFPARYLNAGVAEQNMTGMAAGLALAGKVVFTYSIANFPVMRCLEQIRNDVCYHNLNVKIVAVGGGLAYGSHGYTHHGVEDLAVMSCMPNLIVAAPADPVEARAITSILAAHSGPAYLRLGKAGEPVLHAEDIKVELGKAILIVDGSDLTIMSTGGMLGTALKAGEQLERLGIRARIVSVPFLVPLDTTAVLEAAQHTGAILTVEEHGPGGLGTAVAEVLAMHSSAAVFRALRLAKAPIKASGTQEELRGAQGLSVEGIVQASEQLCRAALPRVLP